MKNKLIFVYNADADYFSQVTDYLHKIFRPQTYACNLCSLTHSNFGMKPEFRDFIKSIENLEFLHKDEFHKQFPNHKNDKLPAIFRQSDNVKENLSIFIDADKINQINNLETLITLIKTQTNA